MKRLSLNKQSAWPHGQRGWDVICEERYSGVVINVITLQLHEPYLLFYDAVLAPGLFSTL